MFVYYYYKYIHITNITIPIIIFYLNIGETPKEIIFIMVAYA